MFVEGVVDWSFHAIYSSNRLSVQFLREMAAEQFFM